MPIFEFDEMRDMRVHDGKLLLDLLGLQSGVLFCAEYGVSWQTMS